MAPCAHQQPRRLLVVLLLSFIACSVAQADRGLPAEPVEIGTSPQFLTPVRQD